MSFEGVPGARAPGIIGSIHNKGTQQDKRLMHAPDGETVIAEDKKKVARYVYEDGTLDTNSIVNPKTAHVEVSTKTIHEWRQMEEPTVDALLGMAAVSSAVPDGPERVQVAA